MRSIQFVKKLWDTFPGLTQCNGGEMLMRRLNVNSSGRAGGLKELPGLHINLGEESAAGGLDHDQLDNPLPTFAGTAAIQKFLPLWQTFDIIGSF